jgi:tetratricopeptide (TPR) repeat protein
VTLTIGPIEIDALRFSEAVEATPCDALALYAGDLLEGVDGLTAEFDAWLRPERERFGALAVRALECAADVEAADCDAALRVGRRLIAQDPTREPVARAVMRLLLRRGERGEALKLFANCRDALQRELGVAPDAATEALYREILTASSSAEKSEPRPPRPADDLGSVLYLARRYSDAVECLQRISRPTLFGLPRLAASLAQIGRLEEAKAIAARILEQKPDFRINRVAGRLCFRGWSPEQAAHFCAGMRKAGLPD